MTPPSLVVISLEPWDDVWRRNQYVIDGLLRGDAALRVLFVEPATDPLHDLVSRRRPRRGAGLRTAPGYEGRLILLQPTKWLPRAAGRLADAQLERRVRAAVRANGWRVPALWVNDPLWVGLALATGWPTLYDMTDDWVEANRQGRVTRRLRAADERLVASADEVVVCSTGLEQSRGRVRAVTLIPNGVDTSRYRRTSPRPVDLPAGPVALYAGTLHEDRLDVAATARTARALRAHGRSLVLVGPNALSAANTRQIAESGGIVLGGRPFDRVPAYLEHADVLVVPHLVTAFTDSLDPIKLYEYQAAGRPIVATPVAGFRELDGRDGVVIAAAAAFDAAVGAAMDGPVTEPVWESVPDWAVRVDAFAAVLARMRSARRVRGAHYTARMGAAGSSR